MGLLAKGGSYSSISNLLYKQLLLLWRTGSLLEHGIKIRMVPTNHETYAIETKADLDLVEELMNNDPLVSNYLSLMK